jgi:RNA polymerase sigma-70 factor, ECF subfamily
MKQEESQKEDDELVALIISGEKNYYAALVTRYEDKLNRYIAKFIYDENSRLDLLQDIFLKVYQNLNSFNNDYKFNSWIYRIAHNECINSLRKKKIETTGLIDFDTILPSLFANEQADDYALEKERKEEIEKVLNQLNFKYKEILVLSFFEDLNYNEISEVLHIPISTVGVRLRRAKIELKKILTKENI